MIIEALLIGLGVFKIVDLAKEVTVNYGPWPPALKSALVLLWGGALAVLVADDAQSAVLVGLSAAGIASLVHEIHAILNMNVSRVLTMMVGRRSRVG